MRVVIADTGPVHYLVLVGHITILHDLFDRVTIPSTVERELVHPEAPEPVRAWISKPPGWLDIVDSPFANQQDADLQKLDDGERDVISLATSLKADLLLMDDRKGVRFARNQGFAVTGTLGLLELASNRGLLELPGVLSALRRTNFYCPQEIIDDLLSRYLRVD